MTAAAVYAGRLMGSPLAAPEHVHLKDAWRVAHWLADQKRQGRTAWLNTNAASGVRVCMAAREQNIDIAGTLFRFGGEPLTPAKSRVVCDAGARAAVTSQVLITHVAVPGRGPLVDEQPAEIQVRVREDDPPPQFSQWFNKCRWVAALPCLLLQLSQLRCQPRLARRRFH